MLEDAALSAARAAEADAESGEAWGFDAWASYLRSDFERAYESGAKALRRLVRDPNSPLVLEVLTAFTSSGERLGPESESAAASIASDTVEPYEDLHASASFRRHLVGELTRRALRSAWSRAA